MISRLLSFNYFVLDSCLLALPFLLLGSGAADIAPGLLFLILSIVLGLLIASRPYHPAVGGIVCLVIMSAIFFTGGSIYLYAIFVLASFQRLHARFSEQQEEFDGNFLLLFLLVFPVSLFALLLWGEKDRQSAFYSISFFTLLFFVISRLLHRFAAASVISGTVLLKAGSLLILLPAAGALLFYAVADWTRVLLGTVIGGILSFILQPFDGAMEKIVAFLEQASLEPREREAEVSPPDPPATGTGDMQVFTPAFPYEWLAVPAIVIAVVALLVWLRKWRSEDGELHSAEAPAEILYVTASPEKQAIFEEKISYSAADLPFIRKVFKDFERIAAEGEAGRQHAETVREWFNRMNWKVPDSFFQTYDCVRYGSRSIPKADAEVFLKEINKIKSFFQKKV